MTHYLSEEEPTGKPTISPEEAERILQLDDLSGKVWELAVSKREWECLAREMLATIAAEGNKKFFASLPDDWHKMVAAWLNQLRIIEAAEQGLHPTSGSLRDFQADSTPQPLVSSQALSTPPTCG